MKKEKTAKKKRRKPKGPVIQLHHPSYATLDEAFTIPLRMSHHRLLSRSVQTLKNTPENLRQIGNLVFALVAEYLRRYRELRINGELPDDFEIHTKEGEMEDKGDES